MAIVYVASSWTNSNHQPVLAALEEQHVSFYDYRTRAGFKWEQVDDNWLDWDAEAFRSALLLPKSQVAYGTDLHGLMTCPATLLVMPSGNSAHLELGFAAARNKRTAIFFPPHTYDRPDLMYRLADNILIGWDELNTWAAATRRWWIEREPKSEDVGPWREQD